MSTEIELKLDIDPDDLPMVRQMPLLANTECHSVHQVTVYYDTPKTVLRKHGFTLRVRSAKGRFVQTVKLLTDSVGLVSRDEVECEVGSLEPDLELLREHPIHAILGDGESSSLQEVIRSDVTRTSWSIDTSTARMQVDLDYGTMVAGERSASFAELEFELRDGPPVGLIMAARRLSDYAPVRLGVLTKADRGVLIAAGALGKVHKADPVKVHPDMTVAAAFEIIVHACLKHYRLNEPVVLRQGKAAALHQVRVAMRRLRSAFVLFRPVVEDVEFQHLRHELRWFTAQLGDARNLDVYLERDLPRDERDRILRKRERAYAQVADAMNSHKFRRLLIDIVGWCAIGSWRNGKFAHRPIGGFANRRLDRLWRSVTSAGRDVSRMNESERHVLRIRAKKLRYAVEFLQGIYPDARHDEKRFASAVQQLQDSLGKLNDITTVKVLRGKSTEPTWLIGSPGERRHLITAEDALRDLVGTGPFWRSCEHVAEA